MPSILTQDMFRCLRPLLAQHPGLRLQVEVNDRPVNPVTAGLDVVVIGGLLSDSGLIARKLMDVQLVLFAGASYLRDRGTPTRPDDLVGHQTLHFKIEPPQSTWVLTDSAGGQHVVPVEGKVEVDDGRALLDALGAGLGIAMISPRLARSAPDAQRVLPDFVGPIFPVYAIYPASGQRSARLQAVVSALCDALDS